MSWKTFEDDCPGCRPALLDPATGQVFPDDSPEMQAVQRVWTETSQAERQAFHQVTCLNSRTTEDMQLAHAIAERIGDALRAIAPVAVEPGTCDAWHPLTGPDSKAAACPRCGDDLLHCERCEWHIKCTGCGTEGRQTN